MAGPSAPLRMTAFVKVMRSGFLRCAAEWKAKDKSNHRSHGCVTNGHGVRDKLLHGVTRCDRMPGCDEFF